MLKFFSLFTVFLIVGGSTQAGTLDSSANLHGPRVISPFGATESFRLEPHNATDYSVPIGTPVLAPADGRVVYVKDLNDGTSDPVPVGNHFLIQHEHGYRTFYAHLEKILVTPGQVLKRGDVIALSGNTGTSPDGKWKTIPPHLHFRLENAEAEPIDPYPNYWHGGKGKPLAFDPDVVYPDRPFALTHPVAYGEYFETARERAGAMRQE
jgi:murein DD-endopeptidase MepM/ murein hydrolase activator NlpD